ncbi:2-oxoglutarate and Fe(II)-dependent oxygenase superfamily protein [Heracleum sosnowskyi]|uniref:2-oxoglutarate and Fe(II)-dependent oxygenase superfamily protein n=1 Tax=Heracleum sosnowskyi TaxID=360622 RepID=A0AAD8N296_9APIA|nr:2-oxoglutarate and Fe(II)-dependent oxygenase superfamily protein [Heracleum sosnowskyi]
MESNGLPTLARVKLTDLIATEGLPSDTYRLSIATLSQSLAHYSAAIIQLPGDISHTNDSREWCKTSGYYADSHLWQETYDFRPGLTLTGPNNEFEFPPAGLSDIFVLLGKAARDILDAISYYLNLRSSAFTEILDNVPLRNSDISSSVLSVSCHGRPSFQGEHHHSLTTQEDDHLVMFSDPEHQVDKSLLSLIKSDKAGLHVRDFNGRWVLVDGDLGPEEAIICPGLALYQATAGYVSPALYRADIGNLQGTMCGRCSISFKLMPKSLASLNCSEMRAAGHGVESQFQLPVPVDDFMQKSHPTDQLFNRQNFPSFSFDPAQDGSIKPQVRKRKNTSRCKPLPPSKRLRLEAQRVLKERVQDIADQKSIKLRFCSLKECESHIHTLDSPCAHTRMEIGWPPGVPFVHPHDLPNKSKIRFLETYEPVKSTHSSLNFYHSFLIVIEVVVPLYTHMLIYWTVSLKCFGEAVHELLFGAYMCREPNQMFEECSPSTFLCKLKQPSNPIRPFIVICIKITSRRLLNGIDENIKMYTSVRDGGSLMPRLSSEIATETFLPK